MSLPRRLFDAIYERDGGFCLLALPGCLGEGGTLDHRANRGMGGAKILNHPANLILACGPCNGAKADAHSLVLLDLEERGLYVRPAATHQATLDRVRHTPVETLDGEHYYLLTEHDRVRVGELMKEAH